jgi:hypothetical protein
MCHRGCSHETTLCMVVLVLLFMLFFGCTTNAPLQTLYYRSNTPAAQKNMIIFLRGYRGSYKDFASEGFVDDILERKLPFDMAAPNAHPGYYFGETLVHHLRTDVIEPAKAEGYQRFWLIGFSMGGLGALMYTLEHPEDIEGILVISPFLGYFGIIHEIENAGGVRKWKPGKYDPKDDWQRMLWDSLKQIATGQKSMPVEIYLGYGTEDYFAPAHKLLADLLPRDHVIITAGGHTREAMRRIWLNFLENKLIKTGKVSQQRTD